MRAALWLMGLFAVAVAMALFAGNNQSSVTWFLSPYRVDMSLNLALALLFLAFVLLYAALRALAVLLQMPHQARRWRMQQKERGMNQSLLEALSHLQAGRFLRARKSALAALSTEQSLREVTLHQLRPQDTAMFDGLGLQPGPITVTAKGLTVAFVGKPP